MSGPALGGEDLSPDPIERRNQIRRAMGLDPDDLEREYIKIRGERDRYLEIIDAASKALVPRADYDRVCQERDAATDRANHADASADMLAADLVRLRDTVTARTLERACLTLQRVMGTLAHSAGGPGERAAWREADVLLAEMGYAPPEAAAYRADYERWQEGRR